MCVCIYTCAFFCSGCCVHFRTGVLGTSACAAVYVIQMFHWHQRTHLQHIRCRLCAYVYMHIYVYMHAYVYGCVCASMILFDASRCCCLDFLSVYRCACACMCICVCMYACICAGAYVCICIYMCPCICMHTHLYAHARGCRRLYTCTVVGAFCVFVLSNPSTTCVCITGNFQHQHACVVGDWKWEFFPACSFLAFVAGVGGYVLTWVQIGVLSYTFLHFCGC